MGLSFYLRFFLGLGLGLLRKGINVFLTVWLIVVYLFDSYLWSKFLFWFLGFRLVLEEWLNIKGLEKFGVSRFY